MKRRDFLKSSLVASSLTVLNSVVDAKEKSSNKGGRGELPIVVSTWRFGKPANDAAIKILLADGPILDAVEQGIWVAESDASNPSVGLSGLPNSAGVVQLDASIMFGPGHRAGSVAALEGIRHPITAARRVMENTPHVMLAGAGARTFALAQGLESVEVQAAARPNGFRGKTSPPGDAAGNHDTITLLVLGGNGDLAGGCSTSGLANKLPGRVGDAPIIGGGLYVDNEVGAAGATGLGENIMRYCSSFMVVEYMRQGYPPEEACRETIRRIMRQEPAARKLNINLIALDKHGHYGAASSDQSFPYAVATKTQSLLLNAPSLADKSRNLESHNKVSPSNQR